MLEALWLVTLRELEALRHEPSDQIGLFPAPDCAIRVAAMRSLSPWHRPTGRSELQSFLCRHAVAASFASTHRSAGGRCTGL